MQVTYLRRPDEAHMPIPGAVYDPEMIRLMSEALDQAWADVASITEIAPSADQIEIRNLMAARIMTGIEEDIRDVTELKTLALNAVDWYALVAADNPTIPSKKE
jgi:hypothetical protein